MAREKFSTAVLLMGLLVFFLLILGAGEILVLREHRRLAAGTYPASHDLISDFRARTAASLTLELSKIPQFAAERELIDPNSSLPQTLDYPVSELRALRAFTETCDFRNGDRIKDIRLRKALLWQELECGKLPRLPDRFFREPPFLHPAGISFAALALQSNAPAFHSKFWADSHWRFAHLTELSMFRKGGASIPSETWFLSTIDPERLEDLIRRERLIVSRNSVLVRERKEKYFVFSRRDWEDYLSRSSLLVGKRATLGTCFDLTSELCWKPDRTAIQAELVRDERLCEIGSTGGLGCLLGLGAVALYRRKKERSARVFMLQILTHELRTPVSSMHFSIEKFRHEFPSFRPALQDAFLKLCDDIQRLRQLADSSTRYLKKEATGARVGFLEKEVPSLTGFLESVLEGCGPGISFCRPPRDFRLFTDPYWLSVCVRNLVQNAVQHGVGPVSVSLSERGDCVVISVRDSGSIDTKLLSRLAKPFQRRAASQGLGLGLRITREIVSQMGGRLKMQGKPVTVFSIELRSVAS